MKEDKAARREAKRFKKQYGMKVSGRSVKTVLLPLIGKKGKNAQAS